MLPRYSPLREKDLELRFETYKYFKKMGKDKAYAAGLTLYRAYRPENRCSNKNFFNLPLGLRCLKRRLSNLSNQNTVDVMSN